MLFLQPVELAEKCFLHEVLYWLAFARLPIAAYNFPGLDVRDDPESLEYEAQSPAGAYLEDDECAFAGIPRDPRLAALMGDRPTLPDEYYAKYLSEWPAKGIEKFKQERIEAQAYRAERDAWQPYYDRAVEYPASQLFVALKGGHLTAQGRRLPSLKLEVSLELLKKEERYIYALPLVTISASFWSLRGTDFESSAARNEADHYCHIQFSTKEVLSYFPGERREPVNNIEKIGPSCYVVRDETNRSVTRHPRPRGRPSYPWDGLHVEVAAMIQCGDLPSKKEAAIQHFQDWLEKKHGFKPSRAAVGEKLKPYYDRFMRADRK